MVDLLRASPTRVGPTPIATKRLRKVAFAFALILALPASIAFAVATLEPALPTLNDGPDAPGSSDGGPPGSDDVSEWVNPDPPAMSGHAMAYDSESDRVILFGAGQTWAYDINSNTWTNMNPAVSPSRRSTKAMAYDSESDRVILFGGRGVVDFNDTWAYDFNSNTWIDMAPAVSPSARNSHAMAYDSESDRTILFGGREGSSRLNDTWEYDLAANVWANLTPLASPSSRYEHAMAYDSESDRVVLFGGIASLIPMPSNATWAYDINTNTWTDLMPAVTPSGRDSHAMAYDSESDRVILFGGGDFRFPRSDTWAFDVAGNTWVALNPAGSPYPRWSPGMAYDSESDRIVLYSGLVQINRGVAPPKDTWAYDFETNAWTLRRDSPPPLRQHALAYDSESDRTILFGGWRIFGIGPVDETWAYDVEAALWTRLFPTVLPGHRYRHAMAYDSESDRVILFGGCCPSGLAADTWAFDFNTNTWTEMAPAVSPSGRYLHAMAYDSQSDRVLLFGGCTARAFSGSCSTWSDETWSYDFNTNTWALLAPPFGPSARSGHAMAYDSESDRIILFGGSTGSDETWFYNFNVNVWVPLISLTRPSGRSGHAMAYDSESDRVILFGGDTVDGRSDETWSYDVDTHAWTSLSPEAHPLARSGHAMAYDSQSGRVVFFGGDTWLFHLRS